MAEVMVEARRNPQLLGKQHLATVHYQHGLLLCRRNMLSKALAAIAKACNLWNGEY